MLLKRLDTAENRDYWFFVLCSTIDARGLPTFGIKALEEMRGSEKDFRKKTRGELRRFISEAKKEGRAKKSDKTVVDAIYAEIRKYERLIQKLR